MLAHYTCAKMRHRYDAKGKTACSISGGDAAQDAAPTSRCRRVEDHVAKVRLHGHYRRRSAQISTIMICTHCHRVAPSQEYTSVIREAVRMAQHLELGAPGANDADRVQADVRRERHSYLRARWSCLIAVKWQRGQHHAQN